MKWFRFSSPNLLIVLAATFSASTFGSDISNLSTNAPNIGYSAPSTFQVGIPIRSLIPTNTGSAVSAWSIAPTPPTGLFFNTATGTLMGAPASEFASTAYTIIASNAFAADTAVVTLEAQSPITGISYSVNAPYYSQGEGITMIRSTVTGGTVGNSFALSGKLPAGLGFNPANGFIYGTVLETGVFSLEIRVFNKFSMAVASLKITVREPMPKISYAPGRFEFPIGLAIAARAPANTGGTVTVWSITPNLAEKTGLHFNTTTGKISGTPDRVSIDTVFTITARGISDEYSTSVPISIRILADRPTVTYDPAPWTYNVGLPITTLSKTGSTGIIHEYSIVPTLPNGLFFNTTTGRITGTPVSVTPATTYTITAYGPGGTGSAVVTLSTTTKAPTVRYPDIVVLPIGLEAMITRESSTGLITSYSITPELPAGLMFNTTTGRISGTPMAISSATDYTITATGPGGMAREIIKIATVGAPPTVTYPDSALTFLVNILIPDVVKTGTTGIITSYAISPALPNGLEFNTTTGRISGTPSVVATPAPYFISATGPGGVGYDTLNISVVSALPKVGAGVSEAVTFRVNGRSGSSYSLRIPVAFGTAERVTVSVADLSGRSVWSKEVNAKDGVRELIWDGNGTNGRAVSAGMYTVRVTAVENGRSKTVSEKTTVGF
jgi:hypothetical protein